MIFDNSEIAFKNKSNMEMWRMYFLFSSMNNPIVSTIGTALTTTLLKLKLPVETIIKKTIFDHFCGGDSLPNTVPTIQKLAQSNIKSILDFSAEGEKTEEGFEANKNETLASLQLARDTSNIPTGVMKLTAFTHFQLLEKIQKKEKLNEIEEARFLAFKNRVEQICRCAADFGKNLFIDAEETWIQDTIDEIAYEMMNKFNRKKAYIFNTFQLYRKQAYDNLVDAIEGGKSDGYKVGVKLVRGAYMEKERKRANQFNYDSPIHASKSSCNKDYNNALKYSIDHLDHIALCAGTHNESSSSYLTDLMRKNNISNNDERIYFAQLYGMSDNISFALAHQGYNVAKYVPYGPVAKVLPYLMRRAAENTSIAGQCSREFSLVKKELARRMKF